MVSAGSCLPNQVHSSHTLTRVTSHDAGASVGMTHSSRATATTAAAAAPQPDFLMWCAAASKLLLRQVPPLHTPA